MDEANIIVNLAPSLYTIDDTSASIVVVLSDEIKEDNEES